MALDINVAFEGTVFSKNGDMAYLIIHEFGHLITENDEQVDPAPSESECKNYFTEGCVRDNSYINKFFRKFWTNIYDESLKIGLEDYDARFAFYEKYKTNLLRILPQPM